MLLMIREGKRKESRVDIDESKKEKKEKKRTKRKAKREIQNEYLRLDSSGNWVQGL